MPLQHDSRGFLTGDVINDIRRAVDTLKDIKQNLSDIKTRLMSMSFPEPVVPRRNRSEVNIGPLLSERTEPSEPRRRNAQGRFISDRNEIRVENSTENQISPNPAPTPILNESESVNVNPPNITPPAGDIALPNAGRRRSNRPTPPSERDSRGRFTSNNDQSEKQFQRTLFNGVGDRIATAVVDAQANLENADPTIQAFNEIATPLKQGYQIFAGDSKDDSRWFRRILGEIRLFRRDDTVFNRAANRSLRNLENHAEEQSENNGGGSGFLGGLGALAAGAGKLLLKKVPILGALLTGFGVFGDIDETENDPNLTRQQKDERNGRSIGGGIGTFGGLIGGAKLGAMAGSFLGPVGTAVGGVVGGAAGMFFGDQAGQVLGEAAGFWFNELREADIPGKITAVWDTLVKDFKNGWNDIIDKAEKAFDWFSDITDAANQYIKEKTGVDVKANVSKAYDHAKDSFLTGWRDVVAKAQAGVKWVKENTTVGKAIARFTGDGTIRGMNKDQTKAFAEDVQRTESGGKQRAENQFGYIGKYQFGADALADSGMVDLAKLKEAKRKSGKNWFKGGQKDFLNDSDNWLIDGGKEAYLSDSALQDKAFLEYQNKNVSYGFRSGALSRNASPEEIAAYAKAAHLTGVGGANDYFLRGIDKADANGVLTSQYAKQGGMSIRNAPVSVTLPSPKVPTMTPPPPVAEAPELREPLGSGIDDRYVSLNIPQSDVGQNLSDRGIAHIVTGGIGSPS